MSIFDGIKDADVYGNSKNFAPGDYLLRIDHLKVQQSRRERGVAFVLAECTVLGFAPGVLLSPTPGGPSTPVAETEFRPGDSVTWKVNMSKVSALSNIKAFVLEVYRAILRDSGGDPASLGDKSIGEAEASALFVPNGSPAAGVVLHTTAFNIYTDANKLFTKHTWSADLSKAPANKLETGAAPKQVAQPAPAIAPITPVSPIAPAVPPAFDREATIRAIVLKNPAYAGMDWAPHSDDVLKATLASL